MHMPPGPSTVWQRVQDPSWNTFRETWWNARPQLESMIQAKAIPFGSSDVVNEFSSGSNAFGPSLDTLYVRNELVEVYARIQNIFDNKAAPGVILTGQPGCGKTISLIFFLVCQLATGRPVMYTKAQRTTYYFNGDGIWKAKLVDLESRDIPEGPVWSLIDSNEGPPDAITRFAFPIHAASLDESKYNNWRKEMFPPMLFLNPWSMEDLVGWAQVEPRMRHLGLNYQQLCNLVDVCGPVPRDIARELAGVSPAAQVSAKLVSQLTAAEFLKQLGEFTTSPSPASDKLFLVRGHINDCSEDTCTTDFKSLHVAQRVYDKWRILNEDEALLIYNFCQQVNAKSSYLAGWAFESLALRHINYDLWHLGVLLPLRIMGTKSESLTVYTDASTMLPNDSACNNNNNSNNILQITHEGAVLQRRADGTPVSHVAPIVDAETVAQFEFGFRSGLEFYTDIATFNPTSSHLYIPRARNSNPVFDAFSVDVDEELFTADVWIFHMADALAKRHDNNHAMMQEGSAVGYDVIRALKTRLEGFTVVLRYMLVVPLLHCEVSWCLPAEGWGPDVAGDMYVQYMDMVEAWNRPREIDVRRTALFKYY